MHKVTIGRGKTVSNVVDCSHDLIVGIIMPPAWTPARATVLVSIDNLNFHDLFTFDNAASTSAEEFQFNVTPNAMIAIDQNRMLMVRFFQLRSGTRENPVPQAAGRTFTVITIDRGTPQIVAPLPAGMIPDETDSDEVA